MPAREKAIAVRVSPRDLLELNALFDENLSAMGDAVFVYGSRARIDALGGDLDLLLLTDSPPGDSYELKKSLKIQIKDRLGDQRVDLIIAPAAKAEQSAFVQMALLDAVQIWP